MKNKPLFRRDFTILIIGQIASLFGNAILRFACSLYVLDTTGSAAVFGSITAISMIPTILFSPIGGMAADRINRRNIMVFLDFFTAALILLFSAVFGKGSDVMLIGCLLVLLSMIQACYQPAIQSSIPVLADEENLMRANGIVIQINAMANLVGPILGGVFYGFFGLLPIVWASAVCFFLSAVMELFLNIPFVRLQRQGRAIAQAKQELGEAVRFLTKDRPYMFRLLLVIAALNLFFSAMLNVGLPYLIKVYLGLSDSLYGFAQGALAVGTIAGGLLSGYMGRKMSFSQSHIFLVIASASLLPIMLAVMTKEYPMASYFSILLSVIAAMGCCALFNIFSQTYAQQQTPNQMLGKVSSFITVVSMCASPLGQALYGILFDALHSAVFLVVLFAAVTGIITSCLAGRFLKQHRT